MNLLKKAVFITVVGSLLLNMGCSSDAQPEIVDILPGPDDPNDIPQDSARIAAGESAYVTHGCNACHGNDGKSTAFSDIIVPLPESYEGTISIIADRMPSAPFNPADCDTECATDITQYLHSLALAEEAAGDEAPIIINGGAEFGLNPWQTTSGGSIDVSSVLAHSGEKSLVSKERSADWHGAQQLVTDALSPGQDYIGSVWVRMADAGQSGVTTGTAKLIATVTDLSDDSPTTYIVAEGAVTSGEWTLLEGTFRLDITDEVLEVALSVQGPEAGLDFYVDDLQVLPAD